MKKILLLLLFNSLIINAFGQQRRYLEDVASPYISIHVGNALGKYADFRRQANAPTSSLGLAFGYLMNPYKNKKASKVFFGPEIGVQFDGGDDVPSVNKGTFRASFNQLWANGVVRYRPILSSTKFNPFIDGFAGYKLFSVRVTEDLGNDESQVLDTIRRNTMNYGIGVGTGIKLVGTLRNSYLDIAFYYQQNDVNKYVKRNSVNIDNGYNTLYQTALVKPNQFIVRLGLTGFLSR